MALTPANARVRTVRVETKRIVDWNSFHMVFSEVMGFPSFYGANMDAWIDCMSYLDEPEAGMTRFHLAHNDLLVLELTATEEFRARLPDLFEAPVLDTAFVNQRYVERLGKPVVALMFL